MKWLKSYIILSLSLLLCSVACGSVLQLTHLNVVPFKKNTRLIFSFNQSFKYRYFTLLKPDRLVVDLKHADLKIKASHVSLKNTAVQNIRIGHFDKDSLRVVFDLKHMLSAKAYVQKPRGYLPYRLVVDLLPHSTSVNKKDHSKFISSAKSINKKSNKKLIPVIASKKPKAPKKIYVIIDPGHGGKDPGAIGLHHVQEKTVVLAIAKDLCADLKRQKNIVPRLTRTGDYFVTLRGRLKKARKNEADLFVAIHADAYKNHYARGASVFALSEHGATSEAAHWLANSENNSALIGGVDLQDKSYLLRSVLLDLSQTATIKSSLRLGYSVMRSLSSVSRLHVSRVEQAPFMVLKSPDIPSILVETGFVSNRHEELLLHSSAYQHKLAAALASGIMNYLHRYKR